MIWGIDGVLEWAGGVAKDVGGAVVDGVSTVGNALAEGAGQVYDTGADLFGYNSREQNAQEAAATAAEQRNEQLRQQLAAQNSALASGMEFDPASISQQENWQSYSHQELYDTNQQSLDQGKATEAAHQWRKIAAKLKEVGPRLQQNAGSAIAGGWEGDAARAANESSEPLVNWMSSSSEAFHLTGNKIEEAASAAGQVKAMVPEPEGHHFGRTMLASIPTGVVGGGIDALAQMRERQQAERGAQETMGRVFSPTYSNVDTSVPAYRDLNDKPAPPPPPPPPPPPIEPPPVRPRGRTGTGQPSTPSVANVGDITGGNPNIPAETRSVWTPDDSPERLPGDLTGLRTGGFPGRTGNGDVGVGYLPGPGAGRTGPGGPGGGPGRGGPGGGSGMGRGGAGGAGGGKPGGLGAGGAGRLGAGGGAGALGAGGRSGVGGFSAAGGTAGGAGTGAAAGRGGTGAGGMSASGQRGQGSEDQERERPGWLEEQDDIWLEDMPKTAPPVFGA
ncbi:PPE domain-containing protein [Saccharopolyspora sp. NPDC000995]